MKKDILLTIGGFIAGIGAAIGFGAYSNKIQNGKESNEEESE